METLQDNYMPLNLCLLFIGIIRFFLFMYRAAKKQKGVALAFGMLIKMFIPDPKIEQKIECVSEYYQEKKDEDSENEKEGKSQV